LIRGGGLVWRSSDGDDESRGSLLHVTGNVFQHR
jgi:hypothetical protein